MLSIHKICKNVDDLMSIEPGWEALDTTIGLPMADYEWTQASCKHLAKAMSIYVIYLVEGGHMSAVAPLQKLRPGSMGWKIFETSFPCTICLAKRW